MEVRPLVQQQQQQQQRHPLMHAPSLHHPQQQQQHVPSLNHSSSSPDMSTARPPLQHQVQPPQILQHPPPLQQPHHGTAPRCAQPRDLMPPLIGQKRDISGTPHGIQQSSGAMEHKLFVGSVSKLASEKDIEEVFAPYGRVDDVYIMRDEQKQSKGCAFVKFPTREMAMAAINALNSVYKMPGCDQPMIVRFADPKRPRSGDTRVGGPGFGGPGFSPRSGMGPRPASFSGGPLGARGPYWRPVGGPGMGMPQGGTRPYGTPNASRGPSHEVFQPMSSISSGLRTLPSGPSGSISNPAQLQTGVQGQIGSPNVLLHASQQGLNQAPLQRQAQGYDQQQQQLQQAGQQPLPTNIQQQQGNHQSVIQPVQVPQQTYSPIQVPEQRSQQQSSYGLAPSAQIYLQPYAQISSSQPQIQQQMTFSEQQAAPLLQTQQAAPMLQTQPVQLPTVQHRGFSYSVQQSSSLQQHQQQLQQKQLSQPVLQQQQQHQHLPVQPLSGQLQPLPGQIQQSLSQQQLQIQQQQQPQPQPTQQSVNQPLHSVQAAHQAYFQTNLHSAHTHASVQPSWSIPSQQQVANSAVVVASTPATVTIAAPAVTCNWTEHVSPEGHKYYYNSVTGESRWEKPDEFAAYEQQQLQQQPQQPQQLQQTIQQQYATSATATQQSIQAFGYGQLQPANAILDPSRTIQQLAPALQMPSAQQALPSVQDWMWKMKPAGS